jgi:predicted alpha/beta-fold hydrolase
MNNGLRFKPFKPAWWLPNGHLQTIWPALFRRKIKNLPLERERLELPDGDFIDLDWMNRNHHGPLVLILHGLEGSIDSHYAKSLLLTISQLGWRGVFMHFRGCSGEPNRLAKAYHSGETADVNYVTNLLFKREPKTHLAVIGFSLGGNVLLKWLGETGKQNPSKAAIAISVPFELHKAAARVQLGFSKFYQWYFIKCLSKSLARKIKLMPAAIDTSLLDQINTMYELDDKFTAPLHGFSGVDEYYTVSSSRQYLSFIDVPTLIVHAKDDPLIAEDSIPKPDELPPHVKLEVSDAGGHIGFVSGIYPWKPEYWLEQRIIAFLSEVLG